MLRAEEFLKAALSLNRPASSEERPTHVVLFLLYHASELYLKCLGTYTYYIGDTPIDLATYETENKEDPDEEPDKLFLSHTLTHGFARIPRPVRRRPENKEDPDEEPDKQWVCAYPASGATPPGLFRQGAEDRY